MLFPMMLSATDGALGKKLVYRLWKDILKADKTKIEKYTSHAFVGTVPSLNIRRSFTQEMNSIKMNRVQFYKIRSLKTKKTHDTLLTSYFLQADVMIGTSLITYASTIQYSVWRKIDGKWKWIGQQGSF
jgi:hypothetical protein